MIFFYLLLIILVLSKIRYKHKGFYSEYLSIDTTNAIKGVFIALVFIRHIIPYIQTSGYTLNNNIWDRVFLFINETLGQSIVTLFLFYSGYGVMESIKKKGISYINSIPYKRVLNILVNFDIAVAIFAAISLFTPKKLYLKKILLSFTGWESVGNSNWYIFVIILCYMATYISFRIIHRKHKETFMHTYVYGAIICITLILLSIVSLSFLKQIWWYDTMLCFGFGIVYSLFRAHIETVVKRYYWPSLFMLIPLLMCLKEIPYYARGLVNNTYHITFCMLIIMLTMKININNPILIWAGRNLFPLYIYQRIPMIILSNICEGTFVSSYPVLYTFASLTITILIAYFYKYWAVKF